VKGVADKPDACAIKGLAVLVHGLLLVLLPIPVTPVIVTVIVGRP
jgi:hypothetical protein